MSWSWEDSKQPTNTGIRTADDRCASVSRSTETTENDNAVITEAPGVNGVRGNFDEVGPRVSLGRGPGCQIIWPWSWPRGQEAS